MKNYYTYWYKKTIKDGLKSIKIVLGLGLTVSLGYWVNLLVGGLFFGWLLVETLIDKD